MPFTAAARYIKNTIKACDGEDEDSDEEIVRDNPKAEDVLPLQRHVHCLLRKEDKSSIWFSCVITHYCHTAYPSGTTRASVLFQLQDNSNTTKQNKTKYLF
mmetsp:Transcript_5511/g.8440  ORF Transcript_5511/g.8440 Transcript_5511/m.8440 type:complete len:101 (+) Transcript_5511:448-750(+)